MKLLNIVVVAALLTCCCLSPFGSGVSARYMDSTSTVDLANLFRNSLQQNPINHKFPLPLNQTMETIVVNAVIENVGQRRRLDSIPKRQRSNYRGGGGAPAWIGFDPSCKGYYNREIFPKLNQVCDDCYNLYRKPSVSVKCKSDCFGNPVFEQCLYDLLRQNEAVDFSQIIRTHGR